MPDDVIPPRNVNVNPLPPPQGGRGGAWQDMQNGPAAEEVPNGPAAQGPPNQPPGQAQQLRAIAGAMTEDEKKDYQFVTKARDRLRSCVPKFRGPLQDDWHIWKISWHTACTNSCHPVADTIGFRMAITEALVGNAAVAAQSVLTDSRILTADQMLVELDKVFQPEAESDMAQKEFEDYLQHPDEPATMYLAAKHSLWLRAYPEGGNLRDLLKKAREGLANRIVRKDLLQGSLSCRTFDELRTCA